MAESSSDDQFRVLQREIRESLKRNHPNPKRVGCVGTETLRQMAEGARPPSDPAFSHVMECSPCYEELMDLTEKIGARRSVPSHRRGVLVAAAAGAVVIIGIAIYLLLPHLTKTEKTPPEVVQKHAGGAPLAPTTDNLSVALLNLDSEPTSRGGGATPGVSFQRLPRKRLDLMINLSRGMDEGDYELQLARDDARPLLSVSGRARIEGGLTVLRLKLDLSQFASGQYSLRIRPAGSSAWRDSAIVLF